MTTPFSSRASMFGDSANPGDNTITGDTPASDATSSQPSSRQATSLTSIKDVSDVSMDMDNSSTSIPTNLPKSPEPEPDSIIIDALKSPFERDFVLNLAESMESLIAERRSVETHILTFTRICIGHEILFHLKHITPLS
ncbi:hypothetical protein FRC02_012209 [Tulasnella sp. 418]|nr:hypothetical protein FRC02_012209 [Tulasnella sp. 418]